MTLVLVLGKVGIDTHAELATSLWTARCPVLAIYGFERCVPFADASVSDVARAW